MAFKKLQDYNDAKYKGKFVLRDDGDYADVVILYRDASDVLVADAHYIKSAKYNGYVHCCGAGCPACAKTIRTQTKIFVPVYNIKEDAIQFWDRSVKFEQQLQRDIFANYPNPTDFVFRITRHGKAGDIETTYSIRAAYKNPEDMSYDNICKEWGIKFPDYYDAIIREVSATELDEMVNVKSSVSDESDNLPSYKITPRGVVSTNSESNNLTAPKVPDVADYDEDEDMPEDSPF